MELLEWVALVAPICGLVLVLITALRFVGERKVTYCNNRRKAEECGRLMHQVETSIAEYSGTLLPGELLRLRIEFEWISAWHHVWFNPFERESRIADLRKDLDSLLAEVRSANDTVVTIDDNSTSEEAPRLRQRMVRGRQAEENGTRSPRAPTQRSLYLPKTMGDTPPRWSSNELEITETLPAAYKRALRALDRRWLSFVTPTATAPNSTSYAKPKSRSDVFHEDLRAYQLSCGHDVFLPNIVGVTVDLCELVRAFLSVGGFDAAIRKGALKFVLRKSGFKYTSSYTRHRIAKFYAHFLHPYEQHLVHANYVAPTHYTNFVHAYEEHLENFVFGPSIRELQETQHTEGGRKRAAVRYKILGFGIDSEINKVD